MLTTAAVGCGLLAGSQGIVIVGLGFFLLRLTGQGTMVHVAQASMARYFTVHRGKAVSVVMLGLPFAEGVMPILVVTALAVIGWRPTWAVLAIAVVIVMLPIALALLRGHDRWHQASSRSRHHTSSRWFSLAPWSTGSVPAGWCRCFSSR